MSTTHPLHKKADASAEKSKPASKPSDPDLYYNSDTTHNPRPVSSSKSLTQAFLRRADDEYLHNTQTALTALTKTTHSLSSLPILPPTHTVIPANKPPAPTRSKAQNNPYIYTSSTARRLTTALRTKQQEYFESAARIYANLLDLQTIPYPARPEENFKADLPKLSITQKRDALRELSREEESMRHRVDLQVAKLYQQVRDARAEILAKRERLEASKGRKRLDEEAKRIGWGRGERRKEGEKVLNMQAQQQQESEKRGWGAGATQVQARKEGKEEEQEATAFPTFTAAPPVRRRSLLDMQREVEGSIKGSK